MKKRSRFVVAVVVAATAPAWPTGTLSGQDTRLATRAVALTFDDLPMTGQGNCDTTTVRFVTRSITATLEARSLPAAGLVTPGRTCVSRELSGTIRRWLEVGAVLGNHTATHPDIDHTPIESYLADIDRGQALIDSAVTTRDRWFRPPYLHTGDDQLGKAALSAHLAAKGYRMAPVTVDNQEWVYAAVHADARARGDSELAERVVHAYIEHLAECMAFYERLSIRVFGREIPQVLLLHANLLNAEQLERVIEMLAGRGYRFVGLEEALSDPAYAREDTYVGPRGLSWLQRWALEDGVTVPDERREAPWVAEAFRTIQQRSADEAAVRATVEHYLRGHATGRQADFAAAFHAVANLYWVADGSVRTRSSADYIDGAPGRSAADEAERRRRVRWIEVTGDAAVAAVRLDYPGVLMTDYMSLLREDGEWRIVSKIFDVDRSGRSDTSADALPEAEDDRARIAAASEAFSRAYLAGDTATIRELYTANAVLLPPEGEVRGLDAIVRYFAPNSRRTNLAHAMQSEDLRIVGDAAIDAGTWSHTARVEGQPPAQASGRYLVIWRRGGDDRWRIEYDMWHRPAP